MAALRNDGEYTIYQIQHESSSSEWVASSLDHFGHPAGFNADGTCWQETGQLGVYDRKVGVAGLQWIAERNPGTRFRLVSVRVTQSTEEVATMFIRTLKPLN
jgi:hypothetical protein